MWSIHRGRLPGCSTGFSLFAMVCVLLTAGYRFNGDMECGSDYVEERLSPVAVKWDHVTRLQRVEFVLPQNVELRVWQKKKKGLLAVARPWLSLSIVARRVGQTFQKDETVRVGRGLTGDDVGSGAWFAGPPPVHSLHLPSIAMLLTCCRDQCHDCPAWARGEVVWRTAPW